MVLEGFLGIELGRIRERQYQRDAAAWRWNSPAASFVATPTARRRLGVAFIRAGGRISGVVVEPCLDVQRQVSQLRG